ncbi:hypothetical protein M427DRAFT_161311 [Gonapodya prolifera JEL478]|uniref:Uncharacterized protein n=1 Tax=Gonapodya prolifera (strain JEL478) TaxID=1344416 RepID=A0A138ZWG0_GONPJ|nr:hypothetical protein M427DRAFT_161311 [Gonapodya prolifera JEL478]|eukprot:KXS08849.1 hypothetical protein M427DRAFT_161311 [Gonapodya prolifera JEL478]
MQPVTRSQTGGSNTSSPVQIQTKLVNKCFYLLGLVPFNEYADDEPKVAFCSPQVKLIYRIKVLEYTLRLIKDLGAKSLSHVEKDQLVARIQRCLIEQGGYSGVKEQRHDPKLMKVLMNPFEFAKEGDEDLESQLLAYFEHVFQPDLLNSELSEPKWRLIDHTRKQLHAGTIFDGVRGSDLQISPMELYNNWVKEYQPIRLLVTFWWHMLDTVNQSGAFDSEETTTLFTGTLFEMLSKPQPGKKIYRNQKLPNGNESDRPDKGVTVGKYTVVEFEAKTPSNPDIPEDAMKTDTSAGKSVRERRDDLGARAADEPLQEVLSVLAHGPKFRIYSTQEPYGDSGIAVSMPITKPITIPTDRNATTEELVQFIGVISQFWDRVDTTCATLRERLHIPGDDTAKLAEKLEGLHISSSSESRSSTELDEGQISASEGHKNKVPFANTWKKIFKKGSK